MKFRSPGAGTGPFPPCIGIAVSMINSLTKNTGKGANSASNASNISNVKK